MEPNRSKIQSVASRLSWSAINSNLTNLEDDAEENILEDTPSFLKLSDPIAEWSKNPITEILDEVFSEDSDNESVPDNHNQSEFKEEDESKNNLDSEEKIIMELTTEECRKNLAKQAKKEIKLHIPSISHVHTQRNLNDAVQEIAHSLIEQLGFQNYPDLMEIMDNCLKIYIEPGINSSITSTNKTSISDESNRDSHSSVINQTTSESLIDKFKAGITFNKKRGGIIKITDQSSQITENLIRECVECTNTEDEAIRLIFKKSSLYPVLTLLTDYK
ncbi:phosphoprotein [Bughendera virus]|uniref:Phosphoprotein n=1 Tax=Bughendera virus TaxID=2740749 RepID=A0A7D4XDE1_9RHAB|nr:phosphoprotein [Bughendera virus]QKV49532.1 phosphoprotein [Bughendera virus]